MILQVALTVVLFLHFSLPSWYIEKIAFKMHRAQPVHMMEISHGHHVAFQLRAHRKNQRSRNSYMLQ